MTPYQYDRRLAQLEPLMVPVLLLAAAMLVVLALAMSAVSGSAGVSPNQPPPRGAPDIAPLVAAPIDAS